MQYQTLANYLPTLVPTLGAWAAFCIPYPYSVFVFRILYWQALGPASYSVSVSIFRNYGFGASSVFRIRIRIPYLRLWGQLRIPYPHPYSVFTALGPAPYSVSASVLRIYGFGASSVFRIRIRIPYSVFHGTDRLPNPPPYRTYAVSAAGRSPNPGT